MERKEKNITDLRSFFASRFAGGEVADTDEFGFIDGTHSFKISAAGINCTISISDKVLSTYEYDNIVKLFDDGEIADAVKKPKAHVQITSNGIKIDTL